MELERKQAEEALRESERIYSTLLSNLPGMVYRCHNDRDWTITFASEGALSLTGHAASEFMQHRIHCGQLIHPDDRDAVWNNVQAALQARCPYELTYRIRTAAGEERWVWEQGRGIHDQAGTLLYLEGFITDITGRTLAESSLRLFRALLDQANDAIEVIDPTTARFIDCNANACSDLGYTREEFLGLTVPDIDPLVTLPVFTQYMTQFREASDGGAVTLESVHRRKDGSTFPVEVNCRLVRLDREYALAIVRDITDRKRAEDALRQAATRLQQAQEEERKRIAREIHDELGQQLTMLRFGLVKLAQAEQLPTADLREQAHALTQPVDAMIDTVRRIATTLRPAILDDLGLAAAMEWLITDFRARTGLPCEVSLAPLPEHLDDTRSITLFRILQEALTNVARHAQATRVTMRLQQADDSLILEIHDNGRGLTEAQRTGPAAIGLFGMQERALLVDGTVTIEGRPKEGTTVTARIPIGRNGGGRQ
jgi:PAS domain S-box-containing protein